MYFPSPLPVTRLSLSTSSIPPSPTPTRATPIKGKSKFKDSLGGVAEEESEEVLVITAEGGAGRWLGMSRDEISLWAIRPKVVLTKIRRTSLSLRLHGPNFSLFFSSPTQIVLTTSHGHILLYGIHPTSGSGVKNQVYGIPGGEKGAREWPRGAGEGVELEGVVFKFEGVKMGGKGTLALCSIPSLGLFTSSQSSPSSSLQIVSFPTLLSSHSNSPTTAPQIWNDVANGIAGIGSTESFALDEWPWLVRGDGEEEVSMKQLLPLPSPLHSINPSDSDPSLITHHDFIMLTSDGRAYFVRWGPSPSSSPLKPPPQSTPVSKIRISGETSTTDLANELEVEGKEEILFDEKVEIKRVAEEESETLSKREWKGICFHQAPAEEEIDGNEGVYLSLNSRMNLLAVGSQNGTISIYNLPPAAPAPSHAQSSVSHSPLLPPTLSHLLSLRNSLNTSATALTTGPVTCLSWTSDGHALAVTWTLGWGTWSTFGRLGSWSVRGSLSTGYGVEGEKGEGFEDGYLFGGRGLFWSPGNLELFVLCPPPASPKKKAHDEQIFVIPFAKSAVTGVHTPDNTKQAFLQMDDRVLVYRGADQPDMSVINPESDVWQHIKLPAAYIALHHPIKYAVISSDARLIAVAGRRGLTHYNALSGRWKLFEGEKEEGSLKVVGGMAWWSNLLIVGCEEGGQFGIRLFSRDRPLALEEAVDSIPLSSKPLLLAVCDSSLLVYTADNTFHHFLIRQTRSGGVAQLQVCGSIGFEGVVSDPTQVRGMSWLVPKSQQRFGDPADDLNVATIIFLIKGKLVLLRPRRAIQEEVKYDLQVLADRIEFYWTHFSGIGTLENSLWGWDGSQIRIWLDALTIEKVKVDSERDSYESVSESVAIPLDFYPLAILMDKGIVVGVDQETSLRRSLDFTIFRIITTTHLFIPPLLRFHLAKNQRKEAVRFASHYQHLVYFSHALEILLHAVLEEEADARPSSRSVTPIQSFDVRVPDNEAVLPRVVEFLDHFDEALQVVVNCARKTEVARWSFLFDVVGQPRDLFEKCIAAGMLKIAASYLLVLHNLESLEQSSKDTVRLLKTAMAAGNWTLCRELLRFLYSLDRSGVILRTALSEGAALPLGYSPTNTGAGSANIRRSVSTPLLPRALTPEETTLAVSGLRSAPADIPQATIFPRSPSMPLGGEKNGFGGVGVLLGKVTIPTAFASESP